MFWKSNKYIIITLAGFLFAFLFFYLFVFRIFVSKREENAAVNAKVTYDVNQFYQDPDTKRAIVPMDSYYKELQNRTDQKRDNVELLKQKLTIKPPAEFQIQPDEKFPGAYFKKILDRKRNELLQEASRRNIEIPEDLGFGEEIPPDEKAIDLLRHLFIKDRLIRISLDAGIRNISAIEHFEVVTTGPEREIRFINEYPVKIKFQGTLASTLRILYRMRGEHQFFVLRNLEINSDNSNVSDQSRQVGVVINVAGMTFSDIEESKIRPKPKVKKEPGERPKPLGI